MKKNPEQLLINRRENVFLIQSQLIIFIDSVFQHPHPAKCPGFQGTKMLNFQQDLGYPNLRHEFEPGRWTVLG